ADALAGTESRLRRGDPLSQAHAALLSDPGLRADAETALGEGWSASTAWWRAVQAAAAELAAAEDPVVAARAVDVREAGSAVLAELGLDVDRIPADVAGAIVLADELGPGEVTTFAERGGAGIVLGRGTPNSHAVVVARGLGIPLVLGDPALPDGRALAAVPAGTALAIDGDRGTVELAPAGAGPAEQSRVGDPEPVFVAGRRITVAANIGSVAEARAAVAFGADGVGLLRTELLMLDRPHLPDEDSQVAQLAEILDVLGDRPVVVRVLDAGGDKPVRALQLDPQHNGFLGVRGLRWLLANPAVLHTQLRAISRAGIGRRVSVMAPMVSLAREARLFRAAVDDALRSLAAEGTEHAQPEAVGVMVEVPAAALAADELGTSVDFLSIGTNDLLSYTFAADRTEPGVAELLDPDATAIRRLLSQLCEQAGVPVHVCGELAADPQHAAWFVAHGVSELSMAAPRIPEVKRVLRGGSG
ncbi:MAG TPA: putative PEP-binding protein, partial [Jatrophihabitans sp.]|nr:putative PEP-binding protein [Jatrophihabitans sp.]